MFTHKMSRVDQLFEFLRSWSPIKLDVLLNYLIFLRPWSPIKLRRVEELFEFLFYVHGHTQS